ncbi:hypothetical protein LOK49_Contig15G00004 [Camellia lanceoleosa]|nr:hypothetical protein LOK49_Contig15G00004 [Camellia lanceoleosa]
MYYRGGVSKGGECSSAATDGVAGDTNWAFCSLRNSNIIDQNSNIQTFNGFTNPINPLIQISREINNHSLDLGFPEFGSDRLRNLLEFLGVSTNENQIQTFMFLTWLSSLAMRVQPKNFPDDDRRYGSSFDELLTIPEQDDWIYSDGKSTSCVVFIMEMYKEAGLFDPITNSIKVTEFTGLDLPEILVEAERRGSSFDELLTIPEQDDWIYSDGKSTSCFVFIMEMYKEIKDAYTIKFFENNSSRLPKWCNGADTMKLP